MQQIHLAQQIIEIYRKHAKAWTALRGTFLYEKAWLDRFLAVLPANAKILDLGCGSGQPIAEYLIEHGHTVVGVDASSKMIDMAKVHFPHQQWIEADMRELQYHADFLEARFDGILAWDSFFHLTPHDQKAMFAQFARFSQQGTALMFSSGPVHGEAIGDLFGDALYHASLSPEEYRALFRYYAFDEILMIAEDENCAGHTVWLVRKNK